jgi:ADP-heptose:LPS heptosyltransferase
LPEDALNPPPTTLVFHHGALGDSILPWPLYRALAAGGAGVALVSGISKARLAAHVIPGVSAHDGEELRFSRLFARARPEGTDPDVRDLFANATRIMAYVADPDSDWAVNARDLAPGATLHFMKPNPPDGYHGSALRYQCDQLAAQGLALTPLQPAPRSNPNGGTIVHPGAGSLEKCWPTDRFDQLLAHLRDTGQGPRLLLGEVELERLPDEVLTRWRADYPTIIEPTLIELADRLAGVAAFIGNDSGPAHLAAQLGLPTLTLFGPTRPDHWAPRGPGAVTLAPPVPASMDWLDVDRVVRAAGSLRKGDPIHGRG